MSEQAPRSAASPKLPDWSRFIWAEPFDNVSWPEVSVSVKLIADAMNVLPEEFHGRRLELARTFLAGRPVTVRRLSLVHELVVAEKEVDYWRQYLVSFAEEGQLDMLKHARGALNDARRAHARADAAIEREQRSFEKADAAEKAAADKRAFIRERDALRLAEARAARKEKYAERERIRLATAEDRRRRDAEKRSAPAPRDREAPASHSTTASAPIPSTVISLPSTLSGASPAAAPWDRRQLAGTDPWGREAPASHPSPTQPLPSTDDQSDDDTVLETPALAPTPSTLNSLPSTLSGASPAPASSRRDRRRHRKHRPVRSP